jgi:hypothetical protein
LFFGVWFVVFCSFMYVRAYFFMGGGVVPNFFGLGVTAGSFAERVAMVSPSVGLLFYQSDTDEFLKFCVDDDGVSRWMQAELRPARNLLINGSMGVWQRGSSVNAGGSGISTYAQDRWCFGNNSASAYNMSRVTNVPSSRFLYSGRLTANVASPAALNGWEQFVEQRNMLFARGKYVTLSFWIRGSKSFSGACYVDTGTTADQMPGNGNAFTGGVTLVSQTVNITTSWQKVVVTSSVVVPTNANVLRVGLPKPSFVQNDWYEVTGVQLEIGTAHSEFEFLPYERELMSCMRYYERVSASSRHYTSDGYWGINFPFKVEKRTGSYSWAVVSTGNSSGLTLGPVFNTVYAMGLQSNPVAAGTYYMYGYTVEISAEL